MVKPSVSHSLAVLLDNELKIPEAMVLPEKHTARTAAISRLPDSSAAGFGPGTKSKDMTAFEIRRYIKVKNSIILAPPSK